MKKICTFTCTMPCIYDVQGLCRCHTPTHAEMPKHQDISIQQIMGMKRNDVVPYYVDLIQDNDSERADAQRINQLILLKWKVSGLAYIKKKAWYILTGRKTLH